MSIDMFGNKVDPGLELEKHRGDQEYLARLFPDDKRIYSEIEVGSYHVVRMIHGKTGEPIYAVYSPKAYKNYKAYRKQF